MPRPAGAGRTGARANWIHSTDGGCLDAWLAERGLHATLLAEADEVQEITRRWLIDYHEVRACDSLGSLSSVVYAQVTGKCPFDAFAGSGSPLFRSFRISAQNWDDWYCRKPLYRLTSLFDGPHRDFLIDASTFNSEPLV